MRSLHSLVVWSLHTWKHQGQDSRWRSERANKLPRPANQQTRESQPAISASSSALSNQLEHSERSSGCSVRFSSQAPVSRRSGKSRVQVADASKLRLYENRELTQGYLSFLGKGLGYHGAVGQNAKPEMRSVLWAAVGLELDTTTRAARAAAFWRATVVTTGAVSLQ